jgi:hypothetical protein
MPEPFFGKYRGKVEQNIDPLNQGRLQVSCPAALGTGKLSWAMPCVPYGGPGVGFFSMPPKGASVWVEFERGDPDWPIWSGCFWDQGELPPVMPALPQMRAFKTGAIDLQVIEIPGVGGLKLTVGPPALAAPATIEITVKGIKLGFAKSTVELGPEGVRINGTNLVVLP